MSILRFYYKKNINDITRRIDKLAMSTDDTRDKSEGKMLEMQERNKREDIV